jgi:hypothetical protein
MLARRLPVGRSTFPRGLTVLFPGLLLIAPFSSRAADPPPPPPVVVRAMPPVIFSGTPTTIRITGMNLTNVTQVRLLGSNTTATITIKGAGPIDLPPDQPAPSANQQLEVLFNLPPQSTASTNAFVVVNGGGQSQARPFLILPAGSLIPEKEPNGSFADAQDLPFGKVIQGLMDGPKDLDVFRLIGQAGQNIQAMVFAEMLGSPMDSVLTLVDATGHVLVTNDNSPFGLDSAIQATLPADGTYYLTLIDAKGGGGPTYMYQLFLSAQ